MMFGFGFHPDFLHRLDGFAHPLEARCVDGAVLLSRGLAAEVSRWHRATLSITYT